MENVKLGDLVKATKGSFLIGDPRSYVRSVSIDTRNLHRGEYFFAIIGKNTDGHLFLKSAVEKGVVGIIVSKNEYDIGNPFPSFPAVVQVEDTTKALGDFASHYRKKWDIPVIAVTGSNGKTTTKEMLASILNLEGETLSNIGNYNNNIGLPLTLCNLSEKHKYAVVELGASDFGEIKRLGEIAAPNIGIITNIGLSHIEKLKDREGVLKEKLSLLEELSGDRKTVVINIDDDYLRKSISSIGVDLVTYGMDEKADIRAENVKLWPGNPKFTLKLKSDKIDISLPLQGKFNIYNALAASAAAFVLGIDKEKIKIGLESVIAPKMRMELKNLLSGAILINDAYNANPNSMRQSIESVIESFPDREKILVLGDMLELGDKTASEHELLGEFISSKPISKVFLFGTRIKRALALLKNMKVSHYVKIEKLVEDLKPALKPQTVTLFKASRGMELEKVINEITQGEDFPEGHVK